MLRIKRGLMVVAVAALALQGACAAESEPLDEKSSNQNEDEDDESTADEVPKKDASVKKDSSTAKPPSSGKDAGATEDSDAPPASTEKLNGNVPCDVAKIVQDKCLSCHGEQKASGVEFSLLKLADFHQPALSDDTKKMYEVAHTRVNAPTKKMPPASVKALTAEELKTLSDWLSAGAKGSMEECSAAPAPETSTEFAVAGSGGAHVKPVKYDDPELKCYKFTAFKSGAKGTKYPTPSRPDFYVAFNINPEFKGKQYLKSMKAIIDNKDVIHHWLFFKQAVKGAEGVTENAVGAHPDGELIAGWAPGGDDLYFDPDVGMPITGDTTYQLEAHYNNKTGSAQPDASGVEICVTPTKPKHEAAVSWLGTDAIAGTSATGTCTPTAQEPIHLIAGSPHMHTKGKHMKVTVNRKGGMKEVIHDEDFDFEYQRQYVMDVTINPGDTVTTTCDFTGPSTFGKGTSDEMCYFFSTHYPYNSLTSVGIGTIIHGPNSCLN